MAEAENANAASLHHLPAATWSPPCWERASHGSLLSKRSPARERRGGRETRRQSIAEASRCKPLDSPPAQHLLGSVFSLLPGTWTFTRKAGNPLLKGRTALRSKPSAVSFLKETLYITLFVSTMTAMYPTLKHCLTKRQKINPAVFSVKSSKGTKKVT